MKAANARKAKKDVKTKSEAKVVSYNGKPRKLQRHRTNRIIKISFAMSLVSSLTAVLLYNGICEGTAVCDYEDRSYYITALIVAVASACLLSLVVGYLLMEHVERHITKGL